MNFRVVLVLPKMAGSAQTHKSISFIWIVWSSLYVLSLDMGLLHTAGFGHYFYSNLYGKQSVLKIGVMKSVNNKKVLLNWYSCKGNHRFKWFLLWIANLGPFYNVCESQWKSNKKHKEFLSKNLLPIDPYPWNSTTEVTLN